jgi:phenylalanine-4-hydroxylase
LQQLPGLACEDFIRAVGKLGAPERIPRPAGSTPARCWRGFYWYTVEFGLIDTPAGLRAYGAGILSSAGELRYAVTDPRPQRVGFDLQRLMRTLYRIDTYQATYFVIDSFRQLFDATAPDFTPVYHAVRGLPLVEAEAALSGDRVFKIG